MADASFFVRKKPYATEQLTVAGSVVSPTAATVRNNSGQTTGYNWAFTFPASAAVISPSDQAVYYTLDGTTPSSSNGQILSAGDVLTLANRQSVGALKMVRVSATALVNCSYFKE